jgi:hypothetical protein
MRICVGSGTSGDDLLGRHCEACARGRMGSRTTYEPAAFRLLRPQASARRSSRTRCRAVPRARRESVVTKVAIGNTIRVLELLSEKLAIG